MEEIITRVFENMLGRVHGAMHFRIYVQPAMAVIFAILDGRRDALEGRVPYFWSLFHRAVAPGCVAPQRLEVRG